MSNLTFNISNVSIQKRFNTTNVGYNSDTSFDASLLAKFIPAVIIYSTTFLLGFIGNILVIFTIRHYKKLDSITNIFLLSLASADLLLIIVCVPIRITEFFSYFWPYGLFMCKAMYFVQNISVLSSVFHLTVMSLERYFAIVHPFKAKYICTKSRAKKTIIVLWILSVLAASPILIGKSTQQIGIIRIVEICLRVWKRPYWQIFEVYRALLVLIIPLIILIFAYVNICVELWRTRDVLGNVNHIKFQRPSNSTFTLKRGRELSTTSTGSVPQYLYKKIPKNSETASNLLIKSNETSTSLSSKKSRSIRKTSARDDHQMRKQIVKMLIIIITIFFICWTPITINHLLVAFKILPNENIGILWYLRMYFAALSYFNSCVNPIVYAFMSKNFREGFKHSLRKTFKKFTISNLSKRCEQKNTKEEVEKSITRFDHRVSTLTEFT